MSGTSFPWSDDTVAVVIPARDMQATLDRTLASIRAQTHDRLDIVVVDDASTDGTAGIVRAHAERDPRVRLVRSEACGGVGAARNRGAAETDAGYLTFVDADDLLTADSVAARLEALVTARAELVYCWSAEIDARDRVLAVPQRPTHSGDVFAALLGGNFIGNGSAILCTRAAFEASGGYNADLFKAGAQGCEDYGFYLAVARRFRVICVPRVLVGYRQIDGNMSSDGARMVRSLQLMHADLLRTHPELGERLTGVEHDLRLHFAIRMIRRRRLGPGLKLLLELGRALPARLLLYARRQLRKTRGDELLPRGSRFPYGVPPDSP